MKRKLTKFEYKHILRHQRKVGKDFTKKERSKLKKLTFEDVFILVVVSELVMSLKIGAYNNDLCRNIPKNI